MARKQKFLIESNITRVFNEADLGPQARLVYFALRTLQFANISGLFEVTAGDLITATALTRDEVHAALAVLKLEGLIFHGRKLAFIPAIPVAEQFQQKLISGNLRRTFRGILASARQDAEEKTHPADIPVIEEFLRFYANEFALIADENAIPTDIPEPDTVPESEPDTVPESRTGIPYRNPVPNSEPSTASASVPLRKKEEGIKEEGKEEEGRESSVFSSERVRENYGAPQTPQKFLENFGDSDDTDAIVQRYAELAASNGTEGTAGIFGGNGGHFP